MTRPAPFALTVSLRKSPGGWRVRVRLFRSTHTGYFTTRSEAEAAIDRWILEGVLP